MPSPPYVQAASVLVFPAPSRRSPSVWLSPLVVGLTVALAGAATGYSAFCRGADNPGERPRDRARATAGLRCPARARAGCRAGRNLL